MSQENVEVVKRWVDAFNRRGSGLSHGDCDPGFCVSPGDTIDGNSFQRREGMEAYFVDVDSAWEELRLIYDEYSDLGDRVLTSAESKVAEEAVVQSWKRLKGRPPNGSPRNGGRRKAVALPGVGATR
jgi:hypothetical protein